MLRKVPFLPAVVARRHHPHVCDDVACPEKLQTEGVDIASLTI